jgi:hypothetical protein
MPLIRDNNARLISGDPTCMFRRPDIHRVSLAEQLRHHGGRPCRSEIEVPGKLNPRGFVSPLATLTHPAQPTQQLRGSR